MHRHARRFTLKTFHDEILLGRQLLPPIESSGRTGIRSTALTMSVSGDGSPDDLRGCVESELGLLVVEAKKNGLCQAEVAVEAAQRLGICDYELARELRVDIGRAFSAEKDKFRGFIPCEDISDDAALGQYAKDIAETNEWGDHIQLHITQSLLKRPLEIYNVRSRTVTYIRGPGDERTEPFPSGPVVHGGAEEDRPIRFIYNGVDHFDAVRRQLAVVTASDGAGQESEVERAVDVRRIHAPWPSLHQTEGSELHTVSLL